MLPVELANLLLDLIIIGLLVMVYRKVGKLIRIDIPNTAIKPIDEPVFRKKPKIQNPIKKALDAEDEKLKRQVAELYENLR
jgi:hypothetical protein